MDFRLVTFVIALFFTYSLNALAQTIVSDTLVYDLEQKNGALYWSESSEHPIHKRTSDGQVTPLARRMGVPTGLTIRDGKIFWLESRDGITTSCTGPSAIRSLNQTDLATYSTTKLWEGSDCRDSTDDIIVIGKYIFWTSSVVSPDEYRIMRLNRDTGSIVTFYKASQPITTLLADSTNLYWILQQDPNPGKILKKPIQSGAASLVAKATSPLMNSMAFSGNEIVYALMPYPLNSKAEFFLISKTGGTPRKLAETTILPRKLAANSTDIYWIGDARQDYWARTSLLKLSRASGDAAVLADELSYPADLKLTASNLYWLENVQKKGVLRSLSLDSGDVVTLADNLNQTDKLAKGVDYLYWSEGGRYYGIIEGVGRIARIPITGGNVKSIVSGIMSDPLHNSLDSLNITVAGGYVYVGDRWTIKRVPVNPGRVEIIAKMHDKIGDLISDGNYVYYTDKNFGSVYRVPVAGGQIQVLAAMLSGPSDRIRLSGQYVYWMVNNFNILRVPKTGGTIATVAQNLPFLSDFVADLNYVYFAEWDSGAIRKVPVNGGAQILLNNVCWPAPCSLTQSFNDIYSINQSSVYRLSKNTGNVIHLANTDGNPFQSNCIAIDTDYVYWSDVYNSTINTVPIRGQ